MVSCAQPACPTPIASRCLGWLAEVDGAIPTLVVTARAPDGRDTAAVRVWIDGELRAERLDGRPWSLDPGGHELRFEHTGAAAVKRSLLIAEGEKNRRLEVRFEAVAPRMAVREMPTEPSPQTSLVPIVTWTSVGVGAAALVVGAITGGLALDERSELDERCPSGTCSPDEVDRYRHGATLARISTVSFIGAGVGLSVGLLTWLLSDSPEGSRRSGVGARSGPVAVDVRLGPGALWVGGALP